MGKKKSLLYYVKHFWLGAARIPELFVLVKIEAP